MAKLDPTGSALVYATFLGGSYIDGGTSLAIDDVGNAYLTGQTYSDDFPTNPGAFDPSYNGGYDDAFVVKLDPAGSALDYATFLGGNSNDRGLGVAVDEGGRAYVTGFTSSSDFPVTPGAFDPSYGSYGDAFAVRLNPSGSTLDYATFLGGSGGIYTDEGHSIAVDAAGNAFVTGETGSSDFPITPGAFDPTHNGGRDVFVAKLNSTGSEMLYATFVGGSDEDIGYAIAVDGAGGAHLTGSTRSTNFPATPGAFNPNYTGGDAFVVKLNPSGSGLVYATSLGVAVGHAIAVDGEGSAYVTGSAWSSDFPTTPDAFDTSYNGCYDAFVTKLNSQGSELLYGTFLGGSTCHPDLGESGRGIAVDEVGYVYVTGYTVSIDFPTTPEAFDPTFNGGDSDGYLSKLNTNSAQPCCDFDGDGTVDVDDIVIIAGLWGQQTGAPYDQDGDGWITIVDILRVARWWGWDVP